MPTGYAFLSGAFGAIASCFAKVAFSDDTFLTRWLLQTCETVTSSGTSHLLTDDHCLPLSYAVRGLCFVGTLALNIFMVGSFLAGMEERYGRVL